MNNWEKSIDQIKLAIECQKQIIAKVQFTKAYRIISEIHNLHGKNELYTTNSEQILKSVKHIVGKSDSKIIDSDALTTVKAYGEEIEANLNQLEYEYEKNLNQLKYEYDEYKRIILVVQKIDKQNGNVFGVMAPLEAINLPDGYSRRIKNIDDLVPDDYLKVYMSKDYTIESVVPKTEILTEKYISVKYNPQNEEHCIWIRMIAEKIGSVYIHSVYQSLELIIQSNRVVKFYDFHGVVPEELYYMGKIEDSEKMNIEESILVSNADYIIVANNAMKRHLLKKYPECKSEFILFPMNNKDIDKEEWMGTSKHIVTKPIVIYSGGLQKWQLISEMQDAVEKQRSNYDYRIYVSDKEEFLELYGERKCPDVWRVDTLSAEELKKEYEVARYGFILRDDIVVNRVACPTKLIDYIKYGIIPIMKSEMIGDFVEKGLEYVKVEDFINGKMPSEEQRKVMMQKNLEVMQKIYEEYDQGLVTLRRCLLDKESKV